MKHDATYKAAFGERRMIRDLLRLIASQSPQQFGWLAAADADTLQELPAEFITEDRRRRSGDKVWWLQDPRAGGGDASGLRRLIVLLEFQSRVDRTMVLRVRDYAGETYRRMLGSEQFGPGKLPRILPVVFYNGEAAWNAPLNVAELVGSLPAGAAAAGVTRAQAEGDPQRPGRCDLESPAGSGSGGEAPPPVRPGIRHVEMDYAGDGYVLVDARALPVDDLPDGNAATLLARIENLEEAGEVSEVVGLLWAWLGGRGDAELRRILGEWLGDVAERQGVMAPEEFDDMRDEMGRVVPERARGTLEEKFERWKAEYRAEGLVEGRAEGLDEGLDRGRAEGLADQRALLRRLAERKFGAGTAESMAALLQDMADRERLLRVGEWIVDCDDGADLIERLGNGQMQ